MEIDHIHSLVTDIVDLEQQGASLSAGWLQFERGDSEDIEKLHTLSDRSHQRLSELSARLEDILGRLQPSEERRRMEQAYNITQELLQSRTANQSLLTKMLSSDQEFYEYFRALAIKEQAAQKQSKQLEELLRLS
ncbi:hypothetical protein [Alicyclobacillus sp. ALC3]|uniref:hypothetical protein n=1 Tax=Alicyclobacillus sp. ALC3 TaxID=2796143 RepID=UPI002378245C|nr:hypothetical protein [Alicyclobacillus sp. ALC3]WDL97378.1 hypothetical protein JC200_01115 [Alicyclobacillus sp. ALC3]